MYCQYCGATLAPGNQFCTSCGRQQPDVVQAVTGFQPPATQEAEIGRWLSAGWQVVTDEWLMFALVTIVFLVVSGAVPLILQGPMLIGLHAVCARKLLGGRLDFNDLFKGFNYFVPSLIASLLIALFVTIGFALCIVPGFVVLAMYQFTYLFIADKKMDFWPAMQASHALVKQDYFGFTMFVIVSTLVNLLGALACGIGLLITIPMTFAAITAAYRDMVGFESGGSM